MLVYRWAFRGCMMIDRMCGRSPLRHALGESCVPSLCASRFSCWAEVLAVVAIACCLLGLLCLARGPSGKII